MLLQFCVSIYIPVAKPFCVLSQEGRSFFILRFRKRDPLKCEIRSGMCLKCGHLRYDTVKFGKWLVVFQRNIRTASTFRNTLRHFGKVAGSITEGRKEQSILHGPFSFCQL